MSAPHDEREEATTSDLTADVQASFTLTTSEAHRAQAQRARR